MSNSKNWNIKDIPDLSNKIVIITGANSGLGFEISKILMSKGAHIIMACRNEMKSLKALNQIKQENPSGFAEFMKLDLADLQSIKFFSDTFKTKFKTLDILINNAGVMQTPKMKTRDNFEFQIGINHLGHFALTGELLDLLKKTNKSRIVTVSSMFHTIGTIDFNDLNFENGRRYDRTKAYAQSKLANLLFTYELGRQLVANGIDTLSVAGHPGYAATNLQLGGLKLDKSLRAKIWRGFYKFSNRILAQSAYQGALPILMAATVSNIESGAYFGPKRFRGMRGPPTRTVSSKKSYDVEIAKILWSLSEKLTGVSYSFYSKD